MLKKIKIHLTLSVLIILVSSCANDEGNYNYNKINEINVTGIEESYTAYTGDKLKITPNLNATLDDNTDPDRYTYEWVAINPIKLVADSKFVIGTNKDFDAELKLPPAKYNVYYFVKDKVTGITWKHVPFTLNVVSSTYEGWMIIGDANGKPRLDMISILPGVSTTRIITDVLDIAGSALKLTGKAVDVECFDQPIFSPLVYGIYVTTTENGTARLDPESFGWTQSQNLAYETLGGSLPTNFGVDFMKSTGSGENLIYSKGDIYYFFRALQIKYGLPQNKLETETKTFYAAPFIAENGSSLGTPVFYDQTARRFVRYTTSKGSCSPMPPVTGSDNTLDWNNTNSDLIYMTTSAFNQNENFAVLKNLTTGKFNLLRFNRSLVQVYYKEILNAPDFDKATKFAVSPDSGYLFYAVGSKLYEYDNGTQTAKLMLDKGAEEITYINFNPRAANKSKYLIVGSYGTTGKLELYQVPPVNGNLILLNKYEGLCKIVDVAYRER
ncbi:PKD-like family lipoprotein [Flavobacterium notoginsengisoli]|uniref:PKD-like family lipoprotein n=1 Tax=Flavobacterium notoginsengisoli TaxID=1478199 RepID=UPI003627CF3A